jgi:S1-C subfamily serine protease
VSRRAFAGYWEYRIEDALFTAPPRGDHSGAGLFNARGELVGIGSLLVSNASDQDAPAMPGNMFVPTDLLAPILDELRTRGSSSASRRAWLGISGTERGGRLHVLRVAEHGPAAAAGLRVGDRIVAIDGVVVDTLEALWTRLWNGAVEREVALEIERDDERQTLTVRTVDRGRQLRKPSGV